MTVREAIVQLERIAAKHGDDVGVYFDCPDCKTAFTPGVLAEHLRRSRIVLDARRDTARPDASQALRRPVVTPDQTMSNSVLKRLAVQRGEPLPVTADSALPQLTSRQRHKGTGDVLLDLAHAELMTDAGCGFGELILRGRELEFVNRAIRVAAGEIRQLRARLEAKRDEEHGRHEISASSLEACRPAQAAEK